MLSREERKKERERREAEREAMYAKERAATEMRVHAQALVQKRERVSRTGYTARENYGVTLDDEGTVTVGDPELGGEVRGPLAGAKATLETPADARNRVTAARIAALGVFALAVPKRDKRLFLVIVGPTFEGINVVDSSDAEHLRKWVAWFNTRAATAEAQP